MRHYGLELFVDNFDEIELEPHTFKSKIYFEIKILIKILTKKGVLVCLSTKNDENLLKNFF